MFIQYCEIECLSSQVFFLLCSSHRYNIQNIKFSLFIWRMIFAYLDSHEKVCSHISLFTYINTYIYINICGNSTNKQQPYPSLLLDLDHSVLCTMGQCDLWSASYRLQTSFLKYDSLSMSVHFFFDYMHTSSSDRSHHSIWHLKLISMKAWISKFLNDLVLPRLEVDSELLYKKAWKLP